MNTQNTQNTSWADYIASLRDIADTVLEDLQKKVLALGTKHPQCTCFDGTCPPVHKKIAGLLMDGVARSQAKFADMRERDAPEPVWDREVTTAIDVITKVRKLADHTNQSLFAKRWRDIDPDDYPEDIYDCPADHGMNKMIDACRHAEAALHRVADMRTLAVHYTGDPFP